MKKAMAFLTVWVFGFSWGLGQSPKDIAPPSPVMAPGAPDPAAVLIDRITARNLFQPSRGLLSNGQFPEGEGALPRLLGTMLRPKYKSALLSWPEGSEGETLEEGAESHGIRLVKIFGNHVDIMDVKTRQGHPVFLDGQDPGSGAPNSEYAGLLSAREKASAPAAVPTKRE